MNQFQQRIHYQGELSIILKQICQDFELGSHRSHEVVPIGYEDFNLLVVTDRNKYFVKIFAKLRSKEECKQYVETMKSVLQVGVFHPKLFKSNQGYLYEIANNGEIDRLCVMEYIDGKTFYELQIIPTVDEMCFIVKQAALINQMNLKPSFVYDHWAVTSFSEEYKQKGKYLDGQDKKLIEPMVDVYESLVIEKLPHCFVHGDISKTNTMRSMNNNIYIFDFAVSNYYPRIQELAAILADLLFDPKNPNLFLQNYELAITEYSKYILLTSDELKKLPDYIKIAHAMHILLANYDKVIKGNNSAENEHYLSMGRIGLQYLNKIWPKNI